SRSTSSRWRADLMRRLVSSCLAVAVVSLGATERPADAYEFWLRAQSIGQAYQLRDYQLVGPDLFLGRRRYVETLALRIWDIGGYAAARRLARLPDRGLRISWQSYLRIDHDFGTYTSGKIQTADPAVRRDALDVIPELGASVANLGLLYGYAQVDGLFDDRLVVQLGRTLADDGWGTTAVDGVTAKLELPPPITVTVSAGFRVRTTSPLGVAAYELDGTSGAGCQEYVEGPAPNTGAWRLIDRDRAITNTRLASDFEYCPQRQVRQPSIGVTIATSDRLRRIGVELGYRRTSSATVGLIGAPDRFSNPDQGLYPEGAPARGVEEERVWARGHAEFAAAGVAIRPYAGVRASLLHALIDRGELGVRLTRGAHVLEPSLAYFYPTFDGDSIFNAFSIEPTADARLGYRYAPSTPWRALADVWLRKYVGATAEAYAGGVDAGLERTLGAHWRGRANALIDAGYGGRRVGGGLELAWRPALDLRAYGRALVVGTHEDALLSPALARNTVTSAGMLGGSWQVGEQVAVHITGESTSDDVHGLQLRGMIVLDLAYIPEP
ncbi:MAG: hypothetical protein NT062_24930, partial [Proteobacteria bacterium]|nr:hypothetical protein [Pseudomonadota bacterium]